MEKLPAGSFLIGAASHPNFLDSHLQHLGECRPRMIRDVLIWLEEPDPCDTKEAIEADDPEKDQLATVLQAWHEVIAMDRVSTKEVIAHAEPPSSRALHDALRAVAPGSKGDVDISADRLGKYLSRNVKVVVGNKRLVQDGKRAGGNLWRLEIVDAQ